MSKIYTSAEQLIGHTPLLELNHIERSEKLEARILAKIESMNPGGSVKDRVARAMLDDAEAKGLLKPGAVIIEPTSGNTGIGLASVGAARGYRVIIVMPETMSLERRLLMKAYGAELVLTEGGKGDERGHCPRQRAGRRDTRGLCAGAVRQPGQPCGPRGHHRPRDLGGHRRPGDLFVAGIGTGGTITGVGRYLKRQEPRRPGGGRGAGHLGGAERRHARPPRPAGPGGRLCAQGADTSVYDEIVPVADGDAYAAGRRLGREEGGPGGHLGRGGGLGRHPAGPPAREQGQDHRYPPARHRRPVPVHQNVRGVSSFSVPFLKKRNQKTFFCGPGAFAPLAGQPAGGRGVSLSRGLRPSRKRNQQKQQTPIRFLDGGCFVGFRTRNASTY